MVRGIIELSNLLYADELLFFSRPNSILLCIVIEITNSGTFANSSDSNLRKVELKIDMESLYQCMTEQAHFVTLKNTNPSAHFDDFERPKDRPNQSLATIKLMSNANQQVRKASSGALTLSTRHNSKVGGQVSSSKSQMRSSASFGKPSATTFESRVVI